MLGVDSTHAKEEEPAAEPKEKFRNVSGEMEEGLSHDAGGLS